MLKIGQKILILLLGVSLIPLGLLNLYWYHSSQTYLRADAENRQTLVATSAAFHVNEFMTDKISAMIIHSQAVSVRSFDTVNAKTDLSNLLNQDGDIQTLVLADAQGNVRVAMSRQNTANVVPVNIKDWDAFRATTFLGGKEYVSPVVFNAQKQPIVTIAAPIVTFTSGQDLANLSTAAGSIIRTPQDIGGVLIETVNLSSLWQSVLQPVSGSSGYTYVVDNEGALIAHPDAAFLAAHHDVSATPEVATFLADPAKPSTPVVSKSEKGVQVLATYQQVARTGWGVITEEPLSSIFATANQVGTIGIILFSGVAILVLVLSFLASRKIVKPILKLAQGAKKLSTGQLDTRVELQSKDEVGMLAQAFNTMAGNLEQIFHRATAESSKVAVIVNNVGEGILAIDNSGVIVVANIAAAVLVADVPKNVIGRNFADLFRLQSNDQPFTIDMSEARVYQELVFTSPSKRIHYVDLLVNPIENDPTGIRAIITILDKTQMRELENMKIDFVSMAAHELRTPLTTIRGYLDMIMHDDSSPVSESVNGYLQHIEGGTVLLNGLINNLLNVSRIERGALTLNLDKIDWAEMVRSSTEDQQFAAKLKKLNLHYEGPTEGVFLLADRVAIVEVINNIVSNAINYTQDGGSIVVTLRQAGDRVITTVQDTGVGISSTALGHLFTKFFRARSGLSSGSGGTGLGLFISKSIVELHHGHLSVTSELGVGSEFTIELPEFDETKYNEISATRSGKVQNLQHGWIKKSIARRG